MRGGMTRQGDELHAVDDGLGAGKSGPLTGLDVRRRDGLRTLKELLRLLWRLSSDFRRQPKIAIRFRDVDLGIRKYSLSILCGEPADVIGMWVCGQNDVNFFWRVAGAAEVAGPASHRSPAPPCAGAHIDEYDLLAGVDKEGRIGNVQHVRIFVECVYNSVHR